MTEITKGATSQSVDVFIRDNSVSTGVGLPGLVFNTASLTAYYSRQNAAAVAITLATQTATGAYSSGGFVARDGTNMPGVYRLDVPDAALASGVDRVYIMLKGAANMEPCVLRIDLKTIDLQAAVLPANVTQWLGTAAATPTVAGVPEVDVTHWIGTAAATPTTAGVPEVDVTYWAGVAAVAGAIPAVAAGASGGLPTADATNSVKIQARLKKNTALANFRFVMTDSTTDNPATGKTVTVTRGIDGSAHSAGTLSTVSEIGNGEYRCDFAAADLNGNIVSFRATASGCNDLIVDFFMEP